MDLLTWNKTLGCHTFNLPAGKCPGSTDWCRTKCYAKKGNWTFPSTAYALAGRYRITREPLKFSNRLVREVTKLHESRTGKGRLPDGRLLVRIHSSGDFYSPAYVLAWVAALEALECRLVAFGYTRVWSLGWGYWALRQLTKAGATMWASMDPSSVGRPAWPRVAYVEGSNGAGFPNCIKQLNKGLGCLDCGICYAPKTESVTFQIH